MDAPEIGIETGVEDLFAVLDHIVRRLERCVADTDKLKQLQVERMAASGDCPICFKRRVSLSRLSDRWSENDLSVKSTESDIDVMHAEDGSFVLISTCDAQPQESVRKVLAEIQNDLLKERLHRVTSDMQTHKNPSLRIKGPVAEKNSVDEPRRKVLEEIQDELLKEKLHHVTSDMQTHKNSSLRKKGPVVDEDSDDAQFAEQGRKMLADIQSSLTKEKLHHVTSDMQTHNNSSLRKKGPVIDEDSDDAQFAEQGRKMLAEIQSSLPKEKLHHVTSDMQTHNNSSLRKKGPVVDEDSDDAQFAEQGRKMLAEIQSSLPKEKLHHVTSDMQTHKNSSLRKKGPVVEKNSSEIEWTSESEPEETDRSLLEEIQNESVKERLHHVTSDMQTHKNSSLRIKGPVAEKNSVRIESTSEPEEEPVPVVRDMLAEIQNESLKEKLHHVTSDMQTHKNPSLRNNGPVIVKDTTADESTSKAAAEGPTLELFNGKWWTIENTHENKVTLDETSERQTVYMYNCNNTLLTVKGKVFSITLDSCKDCHLVFGDLVSTCTFVNCVNVNAHASGSIPLLSVENTEMARIYVKSGVAVYTKVFENVYFNMSLFLIDKPKLNEN